MRRVFGLTARLAALTMVPTLVILATILLALHSFGEYRVTVSQFSERHTHALMTASRLMQQSESMLGSGAMLLLADDHFSRRQALFEIADRREWMERLVDELAAIRGEAGSFDDIERVRDQLMESFDALDALVQRRIDLVGQLQQAPDETSDAQLRETERLLARQMRTNRSLSQDLNVAIGYHVSGIRLAIRDSAEQMEQQLRQREGALKGFALIAILLLLATAFHINRSVVRRVVKLQRVISRERPAPNELRVDGSDEIAQMARSIQRYVYRINDNERRIMAMNRELDFLATHDALTQLRNRHYFERECNERRSVLVAEHYCVAMIDIDHFKAINDTHGHEAGDRVIRRVADRLRRGLPESALLARYGGEEFVALLPGLDIDAVAPMLEQIRQEFESHAIELGETALRVTASFGLAQQLAGGEFDEALKAADEALYRAKRSGRNRVMYQWLSNDDSEEAAYG
ncbi:diguanylate cyclase [Halomonas sp. KM-1]|uniref:GGDEF domain-containing protein n=1 Tax=Halomonas sp. KM-1 TaxID=590061 RepID=UPI000A0117D8|nr:GGDEF domain-containing protein [Halomonas sp. KM-1]